MTKKMSFGISALVLLGALVALMIFSGGCSRTKVTEDFFQSYRVRQGTVLEIYNPNGPVSITGADIEEVEITALKETYRGQSALDQVDIFIDIDATMVIETMYPDEELDVTVSYNIKVPEGVWVSIIECSNGNIDVQGVAGNPVLSTSNGNINAREVEGIVSARSSNGNLYLSEIAGLAYLRTSNGNINAELFELGEDLEIGTSNGSIKLSINPELALNLEAYTSNGEINFNNLSLETTLLEQTALVGSMNEGGPVLNISTSNGSIDLARLQ